MIRNFDYDNEKYIPQSHFQTHHTVITQAGEIDENLLRIAVPASRFQNNPPKTREEQRKERNKEKHVAGTESLDFGTAPKSIKAIRATTKNEDKHAEGIEEKKAHKKVIKRPVENKRNSVFQNDTFHQEHSSELHGKESIARRLQPDQNSLSPSKGSQAHLRASPSIPGIFTNGSERGHTSSYRSLYAYGSRGQDIITRREDKKSVEQEDQSVDEHKQEFSQFLYSAAQTPAFLTKSGRKKHVNISSNYEANHGYTKSPPELPPRDFNETSEFKVRQQLDMDNSDERR